MNYIEQACRTKSGTFHGDLIARTDLLNTIGAAIAALGALDACKKTLFYGRAYPMEARAGIHGDCRSIASGWREVIPATVNGDRDHYKSFSESRAIDVIHALIGKATEAGEGLELLLQTLKSNEFDAVNFKEETFDGQWYDAIGCAAIGYTFEEGQAQNIAKLRKRFPDKFTEDKANVRDLTAERQVLETKQTAIPDEKDTITVKQLASALNALSIDATMKTSDFLLAAAIMFEARRFYADGSPVDLNVMLFGHKDVSDV